MRRVSIDALHRIAHLRDKGYVDEVLASGSAEDGWVYLADEEYDRLAKKYSKRTLGDGPGTELKKLLSRFGLNSGPLCGCNKRAIEMNDRGVAWCEDNIEIICDWMAEEAAKRKLPFVRLAGRMLVRTAIRNAKRGNSQ